jgi:uncharacterized membrane protein YdjX (TVP38/TMEM64 family)
MPALTQWLTASQEYFREMGAAGILLYAVGIIVIQMLCAPTAPAVIAAGVMFGFSYGLLAVTLGTSLGAAVNFLLSRTVARGVVARRLAANDRFRLIDAAIGRAGWKVVALLRLCPMPFGIANYCYGLTAIRFWPYFLATAVAIAPGNMFFIWVGITAHEGLAAVSGAKTRHPGEYVLLVVGLLAAFAALTYITRIARAALAEQSTPVA